uniref:hypothetical protein n=1 Tax=Cupriavidus gilardii TaxID=82541 RepID=UPI00247832BA|nr:hypothetical protein [Cupriavidus gilardii]WDE72668.1 hypothetical protein [Cupriavidus gilardii]
MSTSNTQQTNSALRAPNSLQETAVLPTESAIAESICAREIKVGDVIRTPAPYEWVRVIRVHKTRYGVTAVCQDFPSMLFSCAEHVVRRI